MNLHNASQEQLITWEKDLTQQYENIKASALKLDLTRGKPSAEQLTLSDALDGILKGNYISADGTDVRNYGGLEGIAEARQLGAKIMGLPAANIMAGGSSSLTLMHQAVSIAHYFGLAGADSAWSKIGKVTFICPVPGYDRHFAICEQLGIDMVTVPMTSTGPDMDAVEQLVRQDSSIRGIWCVPKYANPSGVIYSDDTVKRMAALGKIAHKDFRVFWDNAYAVHDLSDTPKTLADIYQASVAAATENSILQFASTSKITFAGAGVAFVGGSEANLTGLKKALGYMTIGPDKVNQLRHTQFFSEPDSLRAHMKKHAAIIKPRFDVVLAHLSAAFADNDLGRWESAEGGYFISFDTRPGLAKEVVKLAAEAGVKLTPAGATFPYGNDPQDSNIRIAPTVPTVAQVKQAMEVFVVCVKLASVRQALR